MAGTRREQAMAGDKRGRQVPEIERGWLRGDDGLPAAIVAVTAEVIYSTDPRSNDFGLTSSMCGIARARQPERASL